MATPKERNFALRMRRLRHKRIVRRAGKALIHSEENMLGLIQANKVPTMIQHCVLAVMPKMDGDGKEQFISAFNICSATFSKHGYTRKASVTMTGKGMQRNRRHQREKEAPSKKARYNGLVRKLWASSIKMLDQDRKEQAKAAAPAPRSTPKTPAANLAKRRSARNTRKT